MGEFTIEGEIKEIGYGKFGIVITTIQSNGKSINCYHTMPIFLGEGKKIKAIISTRKLDGAPQFKGAENQIVKFEEIKEN